jgi:acetylornithine deacetylase/succinyl-diaminopimelate desuccinylase-like protein
MDQLEDLESLKKEFAQKKEQFFADYKKLLSFKSISTDPEYKQDLDECRHYLMQFLKNIDFEVEEWPTKGHAAIFAQNLKAGNDRPTVLVYGHYDVQPADPIEEWESGPFEPTIKNGKMVARGALDNKGQLAITLATLTNLYEEHGHYPLNIKLLIEGEEEIGSTNTIAILEEKERQLKSDYLLIVDLDILSENVPCLTLGLRGIGLLEIEAVAAKTDLHSGSHGGIAPNPIRALAYLLSTLHDPKTGQVLVEDFYKEVAEPSEEELKLLELTFDAKAKEEGFGYKAVGGEIKYPPLIRNWLRPTIEMCGIQGGYTGPGVKSVIPAKAFAKLSFRLIDGQDPKTINERVQKHLRQHTPEGIQLNMKPAEGIEGIRVKANTSLLKTISKCLEEVFKNPCKYVMSGGTVGITKELQKRVSDNVALMGFGLPEDNIHAPNESFSLSRFEKGFLSMTRILQALSK